MPPDKLADLWTIDPKTAPKGKKFWNLFHLQPMRDQKGEVQYFIGVQLDGSQHIEPLHNCIPEATATESAVLVKQTAANVDDAVRELPYANMKPEDLWKNHSKVVHPKPHRKDSPSWQAIQQVVESPSDAGLAPDAAALSAFQYFENVRNFLLAGEEMGMPTFYVY